MAAKKEKQNTNKKSKRNHKRKPIFLKIAISLVLVVALIAFTPYILENTSAAIQKGGKAKSSTQSSSSAASKPAASTASKQPSSSTVSKGAVSSSQNAPKKVATIPLTSMKPVLQAPEFLSGCEVSSLTAVLNYYGEDIDKVTLSVLFLPENNTSTEQNGKTYRANPWKVFVGSPESDCYGCFAPVIVETANSYLKAVGSAKRAVDLTGAQPSKLYEYISNNVPVIVWATQNMEKSTVTTTWYDKDTNKLFEWPGSEHCLVLLAYTDTTVTVCDPAKGIVNYSRKTFEERYKELYQQAVVIQ